MSKVTAIVNNFTGGELSPRLDGRVDISKYKAGARVIENFTVLPHGGARKRAGFQFVCEQKSETDQVIFVPFQYNVEQSYMLMFGPSYVWFFKDRGIITGGAIGITGITQANPGVITTVGVHGITAGQRVIITGAGGMVELNNRMLVAAAVTSTTITLEVDTSGYTAFTSGGSLGRVIELTTTYTADELSELTFAQTNDVLYIAHKDHPLRKISRLSHTSWTLSAPSLTTGPFRSINANRDLRITVSGFSASATAYGTHIVGETCTLTASGAVFAPGMVGGLFKLAEEGSASGIRSAPVGDSTAGNLSVGEVYTTNGNVYGIAAVKSGSAGADDSTYVDTVVAGWESFTRVPEHDAGTVRVRGQRSGTQYFFDSAFLHPTYCIVRITGYTSATQVTAEIVRYQMPKSIVQQGTTFWYEGAWSDHRGYPRAIAFYEQRLFLAGSDADPTVLWGSRSGSYEDFEDGAEDNDAIIYRVLAGSADVIRWLSSGRVLTAGSSMGEFAIAASNQNVALTPKNFKASPQTTYGTSNCPPIRFGQAVLYPQRWGDPVNAAKRIREFAYSFQSDSFDSVDLTVFAEHITGDGVTRLGFQLQPEPTIWARRTDGQIATCTYERAQEVVAWHRQVLGGTDAQCRTLGVIPGIYGDEVWVSVVRRLEEVTTLSTEDGDTLLTEDGFDLIDDAVLTGAYVEVSQPAVRTTDAKEDAKLLDAMLTYIGPSTSTLSGLWHLRGLAVKVLNNGAVESHTVSETGTITLDYATTKAHVGLPYTAILETEEFEAGAQAGVAQSRMKRISQVYLRLLSSLGGSIGPSEGEMSPIYYRTGADVHGASAPLFSGFKEIDFKGPLERYARVRIEHDEPLPLYVAAVVAELSTAG